MKEIQRIISGLLVLCMVFTMLPSTVRADETESVSQPEAETEIKVETIETTESTTVITAIEAAETTEPMVATEATEATVPAETDETMISSTTEPVLTAAAQEAALAEADQETMSQDEFELALQNSGAICVLNKSVVVTRDMTISGKEVRIGEGTQLIIASGAKLTFSSDAGIELYTGDPIVVEEGGMLVICEGTKIYTSFASNSYTVENHGTFVVIRKETDYFRIDNIVGEGNFLFGEHSGDALSLSGHGVVSRGDLDGVLGQIRKLYFLGDFTEIAENAFAGCGTLEEVVLPKRLETLGNNAFANCSALRSVTFHSDVPQMDDPASVFQNVSAAVQYPEGNDTWTEEARASFGSGLTWQTEASEYVFSGTVGSLAWGLNTEGVMTISGTGPMPDYPFYEEQEPWYAYRNSIREIVVEEGVTTIGSWCFDEHSQLVKVSLPEGLEKIGEGAFRVCTSLKSVNLPETLTTIEDSAFALCGSLKGDIVLPSCVESIGTAFQSSAIESITFPSGLKEIRASAFGGCNNLTNIVIPDTVTYIGSNAFSNLNGLKHVEIQGGSMIIDLWAFSYCNALEEVILGEGIREIRMQAFAYNPALKSVEIPGSVAHLDREAFYGCEGLQTVVLREGLQTLGYAAFYYCENLSTITLPESLTELGIQALGYCKNLREVIFTGDAPEIGSEAFENVKATVYYPIGNPTWTANKRTNYGGTLRWVAACTKHSVIIQPAVEVSCTSDGLTEGSYCEKCDKVFAKQETIPALGHDMGQWETTKEVTCIQNGEQRRACSRCDYFQISEIKTPGHAEVIDEGIPATCTEAGLTEGKHCTVCAEVLIAQEEIPATGHDYMSREDGVICISCGETRFLSIGQDYILLDLQVTNQAQLTLELSPDSLIDDIQWSIEGDEGVVSVDQDGLVTALGVGSVYVVATAEKDTFCASARCRVEVAETSRIEGIQLSTTAITTELYSTGYSSFEILLQLPQRKTRMLAVCDDSVQADGIAIEHACFENPSLANLFDIHVLDSRSALIVPSDYAVANPKLVAGKYTGKINVTVQGKEYTSENLTLTVKKTQPKLKATVSAFNSFYPDQVQEITVTGGTVTGIAPDPHKIQPDWLILGEDGTLSLTEDAPRKNVSGKLYLLVETEEWRIPAAVTLTVKNAYKEPTLKLSAKTISLNTAVKDTARVTVTATPADYDLSELDFRLTDSTGKVDKTGELDVAYQSGTLTIAATEKTTGTYKLFLSTNGSKEMALTIKAISAIPTVTFRVKGNPDLNIPVQYAEITPTFKNYNGSFTIAEIKVETAKKQDITAQFWMEQVGSSIRVWCAGNTAVGKYTMKLKLVLDDGSSVENTAKVSVKQTALKVKLSATKLSLNKTISDSASVTVTSATKGYELDMPVWNLMDKSGKVSAEGKLDIAWADGKLQVATNEATEYGATYKLLVRANDNAAAKTVTVTIPAKNKSTVTATLKAKGSIDVIRNGSAVTLTATYKNCAAETVKEESLIFYKTVGKQQEEVNELFRYVGNNDGTFTVTKAAGAKLDHSGKYTVQVVTCIGGNKVCESKPIALAVKMGKAKLTLKAKDTILFAKDAHDRVKFRIDSADATVNGVAKVEIKDTKYKGSFEIFDHGNGEFAIGFKDGNVDKSLIGKTVTVNLNVLLEGNEAAKVNTTVKFKINILP